MRLRELPAEAPRPRPVCVVAAAAHLRERARALADALALPLLDASAPVQFLRLISAEDGLALYDPEDGARLQVQFSRADLSRYRAGGVGANPLRRAIGPGRRHVVDATGGLAHDAVHLAALGYRVTAIERNAIVGALVLDGLDRARAAGLLASENPRWISGDTCAILPSLNDSFNTVYLDPMFPPKRKKSAAVRKEMRMLRDLASDSDDIYELFAVARRYSADRVVVKRPLDAPPIAPDRRAEFRGKLIRYDVYAAKPNP